MCGVPYHSATGYIRKLIDKGFKVAICEQIEEKDKSRIQQKGIVKREVVRVVTKGTIFDDEVISNNDNNFLMSIYETNHGYGISVADITTGDFYTTSEKTTEIRKVLDQIGKYNPKEIIVNDKFSHELDIKTVFDIETYMCGSWLYSFKNATDKILEHFNINNLEELNLQDDTLSVCSSGALLSYLTQTQKNSLTNINKIIKNNVLLTMDLDLSSRRNLELTETIRDKSKKGTLYHVINKTLTSGGARLLKKYLQEPLLDVNEIKLRQNAVEELYKNYILSDDITDILKNVSDVERIASKITLNQANAVDLLLLKNSIANLPSLKMILSRCNSELLYNSSENLDTLKDVYSLIENSISIDAKTSLKDGNIIKLGYNKEVDELKEIKENGTDYLLTLETQEREKTNIKSMKIKYNKIFGYFFEVTNSYLNLVPDYFIRKQTMSNCERYVTPELKEIEEKIITADEKLIDIEFVIFQDIINTINMDILKIQNSIFIISQVDVMNSLAIVAKKNKYVKPEVNTDGVFEIKDGRHPVIENILNNNFVPNDTYLGSDDNKLAIITGPNMAGKSTYMRQVALISILMQIGSFVPCSSANISIVDKIFTRVGASDDLATNQSTFMVEMNEVANILNYATKDSLLILDEIGRGTSTHDGLSIAWSILEYIATSIKSKTLFATHYHELTELFGKVAGVKNYCVKVKENGDQIVFLHKIEEGTIDRSYGIHVAKLAGVPTEVIDRAYKILSILESTNTNSARVKKSSEESFVDYNESTDDNSDKSKIIFKNIKSMNIDELTPREALRLLYEFKSMT